VKAVNVGVPASAYTPVEVLDIGDDALPGTSDDQVLTVFNQNPDTLGHDRFLLTNPDGLKASYKGLEAMLRTALAERGFLAISFTAHKSIGSGSPGNSEFENDSGVIGTLFSDPNTLLNLRGRLYFDRAYIGKIAASWRAPLGLQLGSVISYFDGLPFGRKLIIPDLNQGPFFVMATPRGEPGGFRTQYSLTFDQRVARSFRLGGQNMTFMVDVFNLLNLNNNLQEYDFTGPLFAVRKPLSVLNPRVIRFGLRWSI
jgi:hypothetical protein